jgi:hypothetical protein
MELRIRGSQARSLVIIWTPPTELCCPEGYCLPAVGPIAAVIAGLQIQKFLLPLSPLCACAQVHDTHERHWKVENHDD